MTTTVTPSSVTAPTRVLEVANQTCAYRRFGNGSGPPLLCRQHFTGTLDNWDSAVTDPLASTREVILFDNAGIGHSTGAVPESVAGMATHVPAFLDGLGMLLTYPDTGHGLLFQWHDSFQHHVSEFLVSNSPFSPY